MKVFLSKFDKHLIDLLMSKIIIDYGGWTTLAKAFAIVEECDCALYQYNATYLLSLLVRSSKSQKTLIAAIGLAEREVVQASYCSSCRQTGHA